MPARLANCQSIVYLPRLSFPHDFGGRAAMTAFGRAEVFGTAATQSGYGGTFPGCRMC
jgi:hypothetical protein